jgi:HK97 family phage major capsid protein
MRTGRGESREHMFSERDVAAAIKSGQDVWELKTTMVEGQDTLGGYAVPAEFRADVIMRMAGMTVVRQNGARIVQTSRDKVEMPKVTGGGSQYRGAVRVTWVDETPAAASTSATNMTFGLESIPVHTCMANTDLSRNLVEDAAFNIVDYLTQEFASALAIDEDNNFLVGDGAGKPSGILRDSGIGALTTTYQVVTGSASAVTWDGLVSLTWGLDAQYRQNAKFIAERATYEDIALLQDGNGQYYWRQVYGDNVSTGGGGTVLKLLGYPVLEQEGMPSVGSDTFPIIFGDLYGYVIADRIGLSVERYIDGTLAATNQVRYLLRRRLGGQVVEPWRFRAQKCST